MMRILVLSSIAVVLILMTGISSVLSAPEGSPNNLDCRRFVFAPACRGATIKRSHQSIQQSLPAGFDDSVDGGSAEVISKYPPPPMWIWMDRAQQPILRNNRPIAVTNDEADD